MRKLLLGVVTAGVLLAACGSPMASTPIVNIPTSQPGSIGQAPTAEGPARRIISLAPSNTEVLFALGAGPQMVGRDSFSDFPPEAAQVHDIGGGLTALNLELIVSADPDLVLASPLTPPEQLTALEKLGVRVYVLPNPTSFDDLYANLTTVGGMTGHEAEAAVLVTALKMRVDAVTARVAQSPDRPLVYYELDATDPNAPYTSGPGTFIDLLINAAGGENFGAQLSSEWVQVSVEELIARQPAAIVLGDYTYGGVTPELVRQRAGWDALTAVQHNRIFTFDDNLVSRPGPRLVDGLEAMAQLLHPDLFP